MEVHVNYYHPTLFEFIRIGKFRFCSFKTKSHKIPRSPRYLYERQTTFSFCLGNCCLYTASNTPPPSRFHNFSISWSNGRVAVAALITLRGILPHFSRSRWAITGTLWSVWFSFSSNVLHFVTSVLFTSRKDVSSNGHTLQAMRLHLPAFYEHLRCLQQDWLPRCIMPTLENLHPLC